MEPGESGFPASPHAAIRSLAAAMVAGVTWLSLVSRPSRSAHHSKYRRCDFAVASWWIFSLVYRSTRSPTVRCSASDSGWKRRCRSASVVRSAQRFASRRVENVSESLGCPFSVIRARYLVPCFVCRFSMLAMANASLVSGVPRRGFGGTLGAALANRYPLPTTRLMT